jgi:sulfate adenylyltransferase subunit 1
LAVAVELESGRFEIGEFLAQEREKDLLRFSTAGSVDDGKSTLIGRLLYDTQAVYEDQVRAIEGKGTTAPGQLDFALLTDGLRAEREQGITIDVAYRYFSTARRKFIIADTPGHEQYTRNMATGASTADAAVVLIDARKGVLVQSRRHAYIASLLRVRHVLVAVNKMDLVDYDEATFRAIERDFRVVLDQIAEDTCNPVEVAFVPMSALKGDNVVHRAKTFSGAMDWYAGPSLLELLEQLPRAQETRTAPFRFPVQRVLRPDHSFRGFSGQIASGTVRPGDAVMALPSGRQAHVKRIVTWEGNLNEAHAPLSVTLELDRELDISRGDLIAAATAPAEVATRVKAWMVWMDQRPLDTSRRYLVKHASRTVPAYVTAIESRTNVETLSREPAATLELNSIGTVTVSFLHPIAFDAYNKNRSTGAFILIDPVTNSTAAAGMISAALAADGAEQQIEEDDWGPVTAGERQARWGHRGGVVELTGPVELIDAVERSLFSVGAVTSRIDAENEEFLLHPQMLDLMTEHEARLGFLVLLVHVQENGPLTARVGESTIRVESERLVDVGFGAAGAGATAPGVVAAAVRRLLEAEGIFIASEGANL